MERVERGPFQGILNIIRFNWHYYAIAALMALTWLLFGKHLSQRLYLAGTCVIACVVMGTAVSLFVSYYIYDRSALYTLRWLMALQIKPGQRIVNIHAGFDETSALLRNKYPGSLLTVFDFYDPKKHTEVSVKRARKTCLPFPGTVSIDTSFVPLENGSANWIFLVLAAHEIRNHQERAHFFKCLGEALTGEGSIIVLEHQRDFYNFMAYNIGFFHFMPRNRWSQTFANAQLTIKSQFHVTPFITGYILQKHGTAS